MKQTVDVLAVFDVGALHPRPIKFKYLERGLKQTVNIDRILNVEWIGSGYVTRIVYECATPMNGRLITYRLSYYYKESKWIFEK